MLKWPITYTDFNDNTVTETFYFNLSEAELVAKETEYEGGFSTFLQNLVFSDSKNKLIGEFKKLVLECYGEKSDDGKRFVKSEAIREDFSHTAAYQQLFIDLATDSNKAADFIIGVFPKGFQDDLKKALADQLPTAATPTTPKTTAELAAETAAAAATPTS